MVALSRFEGVRLNADIGLLYVQGHFFLAFVRRVPRRSDRTRDLDGVRYPREWKEATGLTLASRTLPSDPLYPLVRATTLDGTLPL